MNRFDKTLNEKMLHEVHRLKGFLRFSEMANGIYYGWFASDYDVLDLILPHFTTRFNTQRFIIHDASRGKIAYFDGENVLKTDAPKSMEIELSETDGIFAGLWKDYVENVAITNRTNPRLQGMFCPKKYRKFMNEFDE